MRKIAGWNARQKFIERRLLHPGLNRSPYGLKRGDQVRNTPAHHLEERTNAGPMLEVRRFCEQPAQETSCSHHVPGDLWRRLLPKTAYFEHWTCVRAVQRHTRLDPAIAVFRRIRSDTKEDDALTVRCDVLERFVDGSYQSRIVLEMMIGGKEANHTVGSDRLQPRHAIDDGRRGSPIVGLDEYITGRNIAYVISIKALMRARQHQQHVRLWYDVRDPLPRFFEQRISTRQSAKLLWSILASKFSGKRKKALAVSACQNDAPTA